VGLSSAAHQLALVELQSSSKEQASLFLFKKIKEK